MKTPSLRNQGGQLIVEAILILILLFGSTLAISAYFKNSELVKKLIQAPWTNLAGLIQNGVWQPVGQSNAAHPNGHGRHIVITGELAQ